MAMLPSIIAGFLDGTDLRTRAGQAFRLSTVDAEGWLHTGDLGCVDANGNLKITDRIKDMFIVGGFNCYPAEIERMLSVHPAINQVAVVGVPDTRLGEVGKAFAVTHAYLGASFESWTFIDIGCGKGKVVMQWRQLGQAHGLEQRCIGIDYYAPLVQIAQANHQKVFADSGEFFVLEASAADFTE
jgi:SAM-dependent methyltransferase